MTRRGTRDLSGQERVRLRRGWHAAWPFSVVVASLVCLVLVPFLIQRRTRALWNEIAALAQPARALTTEIQLALALETAGTQEYLQSGDARAADDHLRARAQRHRAEERLVPLAQRLGPAVMQASLDLRVRLEPFDALLDSLYDGRITRQAYLRRADEQRERFRGVIAAAGRIDESIAAATERIRRDIQATERAGVLLDSLLVVVALLAAAAVAQVGFRQRALAMQLDQRAQSQAAFGDAARRLNASATSRDVVRTVVDTAIDATGAYGFIMEFAPVSGRREDVDVVVRLNSGELHERRVPYVASVTSMLAESTTPETVGDTRVIATPLPRYAATVCEPCTGLAVGVNLDGAVRAALVLLRRPSNEPFAAADRPYLQALGDLASAALQRVQLLEALREGEERFRQIAENIHEFIWLSDPKFSRHLYVNSAYEEIWGRSKESLYDDPSSLLEGIHAEDRPRVVAALAGMHRGVYDIEFRVVRPNGDVRWVWSRGFPVTNDRGEIYRVAGITEDITERKRITESRIRLVRGFTHDVKNPLGAADGFLALLEEGITGTLEPDQRDNVARARRAIHRALELIRNVLDLARAEAGQLEIRHAPMSLAAVATDIVMEFRAQAHENNLSLEIATQEETPSIDSDASRVRQIVANLVSNALKYTPAGGHIQVAVRARSDDDAPGAGDWIAVDVSDDGPGIPPDKQRTLFREFTRFDPTAAQGAGIGLAISQRVAGALGGAITVQSDEGAGSTFTLWLPLSPHERQREQRDDHPTRSS